MKKLQMMLPSCPQTPETFKLCKNLKSLKIDTSCVNISLQNLAVTIKKLPTKIQNISLEVFNGGPVNPQNLYNIAKFIRRLPNLQSFCRKFKLDTPSDIEKELRIYNKSVARLNKMKSNFFYYGISEQTIFQEVMNKSIIQPGIHGLRIRLSMENDSFYKTEEQEIEEIRPFFRFELFPNLKSLKMNIKVCEYPLGQFVIEAFSKLSKLQELYIKIGIRPSGTSNLIGALLELPPLRKFSLSISSLKEEDWRELKKFLQKQKGLESFCLKLVRPPFDQMNDPKYNSHLQGMVQDLQSQSLKYLELKSTYWSPYAYAEGLKSLAMKNQLVTFKMEARVNIDPRKTRRQVEGLCNFLVEQKGSLQNLQLSLDKVPEYTSFDQIFSTISKLVQLRDLEFSIRKCQENFTTEEMREILPIKSLKKMEFDFAFLSHLENLENYSFSFDEDEQPFYLEEDNFPPQDLSWIVQMLRNLGDLRKFAKNLH